MSLDMTALIQYSGQGRCEEVSLMLMESEHGEEVRSWAQRINWSLTTRNIFNVILNKMLAAWIGI